MNWQREIALTPIRTFGGDHLHQTATLDLRALREIQRAFTAETGLDASTASVRVIGKVHVSGVAEGSTIAGNLAPRIDFTLSAAELVPKLPTTDGARSDAVSVVKTGSVVESIGRPRAFGLGPLHISGGLARRLSLILVAAVLAACAAAIALDRKRPAKDEAARIIAKYRYLLVTADSIPALHHRPVVLVDNMRDLARLAKVHDELIVHADESGLHRFALFTDPVVYLLEVGMPAMSTSDVATPAGSAEETELAEWALAGLEAHAATRRRQAPRPPARRHSRPAQGSNVIDAGATADSTR